jgi:hypothetical protein
MCLLLKHRSIILLALVASLSITASSQKTETLVTMKPDALSQVSTDKPARLAERIELYVRSMNELDLDEIYALMPKSCARGLDRNNWRKQVHAKPSGLLRAFAVSEIYAGDWTLVANVDGEKWIATGCGTYQTANKTVTHKASINLVLAGDEWYICGSGVAVEGKHNKPMPCDGT